MRILSQLLIILMPYFAISQDTTKIVSSDFGIELHGMHITPSLFNNKECISCPRKEIQDNPFNHFAIYSGIKHKLSLNNKYKLETSLYLEERSFSGGNNTLDNIVIYPRIRFSGIDTITIFDTEIKYKIDGGDFWNEELSDIIRMYNIDFHASSLAIGFKNSWIGLMTIGDLATNIGLGLHQYYKLFYSQSLGRYANTFSISLNQLSLAYGHITSEDYNFANYSSVRINNSTTLTGQVESRYNLELGLSFGLAAQLYYSKGNLKLLSRLKYFDANFNLGYKNYKPSYHDGSSFVGDQLYPLRNYHRTYSQWATYTDFQKQQLIGFENHISYNTKLYKNIYFDSDVDITTIYSITDRNLVLIPLYRIGLRIDFLKELNSHFCITNKHMDLGSFYQSFNASKMPFFSYSVTLDLDSI